MLFDTLTNDDVTVVFTVEFVDIPIFVALAVTPADPNPEPVVSAAALTVAVVNTPNPFAVVTDAMLALVAAYNVAVFT